MNNNFHDNIEQFVSSLKKMPAVKKFYRFPEKKTQEEKLIPRISSEEFNLSLFSKAIKATYSWSLLGKVKSYQLQRWPSGWDYLSVRYREY